VHGTAIGDVEELGSLVRGEGASQGDLPLDPVEHSLLSLAFGTVRRVNLRVLEPDHDLLERPPFASRIQRDRHRRSGAKRPEEQIVGRWSAIRASRRFRFIRNEAMPADVDVLEEPGHSAMHDDFAHCGPLQGQYSHTHAHLR